MTFGNFELNSDQYGLIPSHTLHALEQFLSDGQPVGGFLTAVLDNDLKNAIGRADRENLSALEQIVKLIYNYFPAFFLRENSVDDYLNQEARYTLGANGAIIRANIKEVAV